MTLSRLVNMIIMA